jgi:hypothetical protein
MLADADVWAADYGFSVETIKAAVERAKVNLSSVEVELPDGVTIFVDQTDNGTYLVGRIVHCWP